MPRTTKSIAEAIRRQLENDPDLAEAVERERFNASVGTAIYAARMDAGLTQKQLADRVGTQQSVIARLENADYDSHSLSMLRRIADALGKRLQVGFVTQSINSGGVKYSRSKPIISGVSARRAKSRNSS